MIEELKETIAAACQKLFGQRVEVELTRPDPQFGDFSTNVAMQLAKKTGKNPHEIADAIKAELKDLKAEVAGPGFINISLNDAVLWQAVALATELPKPHAGKEVLVEFGDPNPFKEMHIGHVYAYVAGDTIASLLEASGAKVERLSYHGDVGLHVAKAIWGLQKAKVEPVDGKIEYTVNFNIGSYYAAGAQAYETNEEAKIEINHINQHVYGHDNQEINRLYEWGRQASLTHFGQVLRDLDIAQTKQYFESDATKAGVKLVRENEGKVFKISEGALVFEGEKAGLHTRVFMTSQGLPTYEAKDLGLAELKDHDYPNADKSLIITAHEQAEYFKVMLAALAEIDQALADKTQHLYHGFVSLSSGKMSSRTGQVYSATSFIADIDQAVSALFKGEAKNVRNAAIKYGLLKHRLGSDIVYDVGESISLQGDSGPYLQYAHARACSILAKTGDQQPQAINGFEPGERRLAAKLSHYPEVFSLAVNELKPHYICGYLYELAQEFNRFYEANRVIADERENQRLQLVKIYRDVLASGLKLLKIEAPEKI